MKKFEPISRLTKDKTAFLCCDIQSIFQRTIHRFDHIAHSSSLLVRAAKIFGVPVIVSEQYPQKLGLTVPTIDITNAIVYAKTKFSMMTDGFPDSIRLDKNSFVLFGLETHVCVQQTALDLLAEGKHVVLVTDAVSSSRPLDRTTALHRLSQAGADLMTTEAVLFELLQSKDAPEFKEISSIAKEISKFANQHPDGILSSL